MDKVELPRLKSPNSSLGSPQTIVIICHIRPSHPYIRTDDLRVWHVENLSNYSSTYMVAFFSLSLTPTYSVFSNLFHLFYKKRFEEFYFGHSWVTMAHLSQATHHSDWLSCHSLLFFNIKNNHLGTPLTLYTEKEAPNSWPVRKFCSEKGISRYYFFLREPRITGSAAWKRKEKKLRKHCDRPPQFAKWYIVSPFSASKNAHYQPPAWSVIPKPF